MYKLSEDHEYKICNDTEEYIIDSEVPVKAIIESNKVIAYLDIDGTIFNLGKVIIMEDESYAIDFYRFSKNEKNKNEKNILYGKNKSKALFDLHNHEILFFNEFVRNKENLELLNNNKKCVTKWKLAIDMDNHFNVSIINGEDKICLGYI